MVKYVLKQTAWQVANVGISRLFSHIVDFSNHVCFFRARIFSSVMENQGIEYENRKPLKTYPAHKLELS